MSKLTYEKPQLSLLTEIASSTTNCNNPQADVFQGEDGTACDPGVPPENS